MVESSVKIATFAISIYECRKMGRNKFSEKEIKAIVKLLKFKNSVNRGKQKLIRHDLRVDYEFNISDFNEPGKAFGEEELMQAIERGAIQILRPRQPAAKEPGKHRPNPPVAMPGDCDTDTDDCAQRSKPPNQRITQ